ncbi:MAG: NAD-binding protein [Actinomycetota bacterium]
MFVVIVGGGKVGSYLARMLREANHEVTLVEERREQCAKISEEIPGATIICGDGCEPYILDEARLSKADAAVAVTGHDEDNLVVCLLSKYEYELPLTIARINNPRNAWLFTKKFGVDIPVNNTEMIAKLLQEEVTIGDLVTLLKLRKGDVALVELTLTGDCPSIGKPIKDLGLPPDAVLVTIIRDNEILIPKGTTVLQADDEVLAVTNVASEPILAECLMGSKPA